MYYNYIGFMRYPNGNKQTKQKQLFWKMIEQDYFENVKKYYKSDVIFTNSLKT